MKIALVHDYIKEYGGAERVLKTLTEMYPEAPIYTAFKVKNSTAEKVFRDKIIVESWLAPLVKIWKLYSPLRFLAPIIWRSFDLSKFDLVITSSSWYITRGFKIGPETKVICYCHTPPRWLYGYETSVGFTKYWPVKIYSAIVGHSIRMYDYKTAQKPIRNTKYRIRNTKTTAGVDYFIANSENVRARIEKFYRRDSTVIYPPIDVSRIMNYELRIKGEKEGYFLIVSRLVGAKGLEEVAKAFRNIDCKLKIVGESHGFSDVERKLKKMSGGNIELVGRVTDDELYKLYSSAKGFIALAKDEDFGMTVVEAQAAGCPVIAFNGGGFRESVIDPSTNSGQVATGILINDTDEKTIQEAVKKIMNRKWDKRVLQENAKRFSKEIFERKIGEFVESKI